MNRLQQARGQLQRAQNVGRKLKRDADEVGGIAREVSKVGNQARDFTGGKNLITRGMEENFGALGDIPVIGDIAKAGASVGDTILNLFGVDPGLTEEEKQILRQKFINEGVEDITARIKSPYGIQLALGDGRVVRVVDGKKAERNYTPTEEQKQTGKKLKNLTQDDLIKEIEDIYQEYSSGYGVLAGYYKSGENEGELIKQDLSTLEDYGYHLIGYPGKEQPPSVREKYLRRYLRAELGLSNDEMRDWLNAWKRYIRVREGGRDDSFVSRFGTFKKS